MRTVARWLSLIVIFTIPWEDSVSVQALGSLSRLVGIAVAGFWLLTVVIEGRFRKPRLFHVAVYLFVVWNVASALWSLGIEETEQRIKTYAQLLVLVLLLWDLYTTPAALRAGLQAYVAGAWVATGSTISNYIVGKEAYLYSGGRYSAVGANPGDLVITLALGLPIAWYLASSAGAAKAQLVLRLVNYAYVPGSLFAIGLSATRMGLFAVVPAVLYCVVAATRLSVGMRVLIIVALTAAVLALLPYIPQTAVDRLATAGDSIAAGDLGGRVYLWRGAIVQFAAHPLKGVGSGAFRTVNEPHAVAHNTFLSVLAELGIVGFALFVLVLVVAGLHAVRQPWIQSGHWLAALMVWVVGVSAQTWEQKKMTWLLLSFVVISASLFFDADRPSLRVDLRAEPQTTS